MALGPSVGGPRGSPLGLPLVEDPEASSADDNDVGLKQWDSDAVARTSGRLCDLRATGLRFGRFPRDHQRRPDEQSVGFSGLLHGRDHEGNFLELLERQRRNHRELLGVDGRRSVRGCAPGQAAQEQVRRVC